MLQLTDYQPTTLLFIIRNKAETTNPRPKSQTASVSTTYYHPTTLLNIHSCPILYIDCSLMYIIILIKQRQINLIISYCQVNKVLKECQFPKGLFSSINGCIRKKELKVSIDQPHSTFTEEEYQFTYSINQASNLVFKQ